MSTLRIREKLLVSAVLGCKVSRVIYCCVGVMIYTYHVMIFNRIENEKTRGFSNLVNNLQLI